MKMYDALEFYGSQKRIAEVLGLTQSAISQWSKRHEGLVPQMHAFALALASGGALVFDHRKYKGIRILRGVKPGTGGGGTWGKKRWRTAKKGTRKRSARRG